MTSQFLGRTSASFPSQSPIHHPTNRSGAGRIKKKKKDADTWKHMISTAMDSSLPSVYKTKIYTLESNLQLVFVIA